MVELYNRDKGLNGISQKNWPLHNPKTWRKILHYPWIFNRVKNTTQQNYKHRNNYCFLYLQVLHRSRRRVEVLDRVRQSSFRRLDRGVEAVTLDRPQVSQVRLSTQTFARSEETHSQPLLTKQRKTENRKISDDSSILNKESNRKRNAKKFDLFRK